MATPLTNTPIPAYTAVPDVPADLQNALNNLEKYVITRFASTAARNAAITAPTEGQFSYTTDTDTLWYYDGTAWVDYVSFAVPLLPVTQTSFFNNAFNITSAAGVYQSISTPVVATISNPSATRGMEVEAIWGAWMVATNVNTRVSTKATGSNTWTVGQPGPAGTFGSNILICTLAGGTVAGSLAFRFTVPAGGTTTVEVMATREQTGVAGQSNAANYPYIQLAPTRYV